MPYAYAIDPGIHLNIEREEVNTERWRNDAGLVEGLCDIRRRMRGVIMPRLGLMQNAVESVGAEVEAKELKAFGEEVGGEGVPSKG
jgi:hypothetical protein